MKIKEICFVVTSPFAVNGFLINHLAELSKFYKVTLCTNLNIYPLSPKFDISNIVIINVPIERKISFCKDLTAWWFLFKIFRNSQFLSVHSITPKAGLLGMSAAFLARVPNRIHTFTGQIWIRKSGFFRTILKRCDWLIAKFATLLFADSKSQIKFLLNEHICKSSHINLIGAGSIAGVDLQRFFPSQLIKRKVRQELLSDPNDCVFIFVGRLNEEKGLCDLFEAFGKLYENYIKAALWIVGPDEEEIAVKINNIFPELYKRAKWIGATHTPELYMAAADVLILPSHREGFGNVIIEAAACNLPTIAYRIDGVIDAVLDGETGFLLDFGDIQGLSVKMETMLNDVELRLRMGHLARVRASSEFSSEMLTQEWVKFYKNFI